MKTYILLFSLFCFGSAEAAMPIIVGNPRYKKELNESVDDYMGRKYYVEFMLDSPQVLGSGHGATLGGGYLHEMVGFDLRFRFGTMQVGQFFSPPTQLEAAESPIQDPNSATNAPQIDTNAWSYTMIEPGVSVTAKLFPETLKKWSETARVGFAKSSFSDTINSVSYSGWILSTEAVFQYHFSYLSKYSLLMGLGFNWGWITRSTAASGTLTDNTLPIRFGRYIVGLNYAF